MSVIPFQAVSSCLFPFVEGWWIDPGCHVDLSSILGKSLFKHQSLNTYNVSDSCPCQELFLTLCYHLLITNTIKMSYTLFTVYHIVSTY